MLDKIKILKKKLKFQIKGELILTLFSREFKILEFLRYPIYMAGVAGFEPAVHDTKNRCLTTWLHPIRTFFY